MEQFIEYLTALDPIWVYCVAGAIAYIENVFPPLPSDMILVAAGSIAALGRVDFALLLVISTLGSTTGFLTMYKVGDWFGIRILEAGKIKYIPLEKVHKVEAWFKTYGYWIVVVNRFLAGTRAVISFFTGMSQLSLWRTTVLSFLSSLLWNFILLFAGRELGKKWKEITHYLQTYGETVTAIVVLGLLIYFVRFYYKKRNHKNSSINSSAHNHSDK